MRSSFRFSSRFVIELVLVLVALALFAWAWRADRAWFEAHVFWRFCTAEPREIRRVYITRSLAVAAGLVLVTVVRPRLGRWVATSPNPARAALPLLLAAIGALGVCDVALRYRPQHGQVDADPWIVAVPGYLFYNRTGTTVRDYEGRKVWVSIDNAGHRVRSAEATLDPALPTILFTGESVAFGHGVSYDDSYPAKVGVALGIQSANSAVSAYGNDQIYMRAHEDLALFKDPVAVVTLVVPNEIIRNIEPIRPHFLPKEDGTIEVIPATPTWIALSPVRELFGNLFPYHSDRALDIARAALSATAREAEAKGAYPLFVFSNWGDPCYPPRPGDPSIEDKLFKGLNLHVLNVPLNPLFWDEPSHHPDARAHDQLAGPLIAALRPVLAARGKK